MSGLIHEDTAASVVPVLHTDGAWETVLSAPAARSLEAVLPRFMTPRRWFGAKARTVRDVVIVEAIPILPTAQLVVVAVTYAEGEAERYVLPIGFAAGVRADQLEHDRPHAVIARLVAKTDSGILYDAVWNPDFCQALLATISEGRLYRGVSGDVVASATAVLPHLLADSPEALPPVLLGVEQSNTSIRYGDRLILKLYRRLEAGVNPDQEIGAFLTEKARFPNTPPLAGALEFRRHAPADAEPVTLALLQGFVPNQGDAWSYSLDTLADYYSRARSTNAGPPVHCAAPLLELIEDGVPQEAEALIGPYLGAARLLGRRTAELHLALASDPTDPVFGPTPFTATFQNYLHTSMRELTGRILGLLRMRFDALTESDRADAAQVLALEDKIASRFDALLGRPIRAMLSRIHGDYHLGQVLYTGEDFMIIDFEGEPARPLSERRMQRSPLQDVAGMLRSFHYAAYAAYFRQVTNRELEPWARFWRLWVSVAYLKTYLEVANAAAFLPASPGDLDLLLNAYLLEKAVYELGYELNNRPAWARIPLQGILQTVTV